MKKNSFTVLELLIVFMLIGLISVVGVMTVGKPWETGYKYAYINVLNVLESSVYSQMAEIDKWVFNADDKWGQSDITKLTAEKFCKVIDKYSNTLVNNCTEDPIIISSYNENGTGAPSYNPDAAVFETTPPHLILSNGVKLWIAANNKSTGADAKNFFNYCMDLGPSETCDDQNAKAHYYIVFADLNGDRKPNSPKKNGNSLPDIVAFAVTDRVATVPLGLPAVNKRYLTAYLSYPNVADNGGDGGQSEVTVPMTYFEAKVKSYGTYRPNGALNPNRIFLDQFAHSYDFEKRIFAPKGEDPAEYKNDFRFDNAIAAGEYDFREFPEFDVDVCGQGSRIECFSTMTEEDCENDSSCPSCLADQCEVKFLQSF